MLYNIVLESADEGSVDFVSIAPASSQNKYAIYKNDFLFEITLLIILMLLTYLNMCTMLCTIQTFGKLSR